jgi:predicted acetyltransferase
MIVEAKPEDLNQVKEMWRICFPQEDPAYIDFYFKKIWKPESCWLSREDDETAASLCRNKHAMMFNNKVLEVSMITGICTLPQYRNKGHMHQLMNTLTDAASHSELLTLLRTEQPELYEPFGFRKAYERTAYMIQRPDLKRIPTFGVAYDIKALDMLKVYNVYIRRFTGFFARSLEDFIRYKEEIVAEGGKIIGYFNEQDRIDGYAALKMAGSDLYVDELVYLDSKALSKLLNACLAERPRVHFHTSRAENLSFLLPHAARKEYATMMVRVNQYDLFNKLFHVDAHNVRDALAAARRPLNLNETH